jgi:TolA-binding protein
MKPQVLAADTTPMPGGELARLRDIVTGPFLGGDVKGAQKMFLDFLRLPRTAEIEAHARFYLGQTYYIEGRQRDALLQFLLAQEHYYQETKPWEDACFELLIRADR